MFQVNFCFKFYVGLQYCVSLNLFLVLVGTPKLVNVPLHFVLCFGSREKTLETEEIPGLFLYLGKVFLLVHVFG